MVVCITENQLIQFFVRAMDHGSPPMENDVPVNVYVMGAKDIPPHFLDQVYTYLVNEARAIGDQIVTITAESNETLQYSIVPGGSPYTNNPPKFAIDQQGKVTILEALDRETTDRFDLTIKAETKTSPPLVAFAQVNVKIKDANDNKPVFEANPYEVEIIESVKVGTSIIQIIARDKDYGTNAQISYDFAPEHKTLSSVFAIDSHSGWLTTLVELDRETIDLYEFDIMATDGSEDSPLSDVTNIRVIVTDHNDNPPVFSQKTYRGAVNENALPGTIILTVSTNDADIGSNEKVCTLLCIFIIHFFKRNLKKYLHVQHVHVSWQGIISIRLHSFLRSLMSYFMIEFYKVLFVFSIDNCN